MFGASYFGPRYFGDRYFGKVGDAVPGQYLGGRYFGPTYFGTRYFGARPVNDFAFSQTSAIGIAGNVGTGNGTGSFAFGSDFAFNQIGSIGIGGTLAPSGDVNTQDNRFPFAADIRLPINGTVAVAGSLEIAVLASGPGSYFGRRYFGGRYFGPRYFGSDAPWEFAQTAPIGVAGAMAVAGSVGTQIGFSATSPIGISGTITPAGQFGVPTFAASGTAPIGLAGTLGLVGAFGIGFEGFDRLVPIPAEERHIELDLFPNIIDIEADDRVIDCGDFE